MATVGLGVPEQDVARVRESGVSPRIALVLGSGFAGLSAMVETPQVIPYCELAGTPRVDAVAGHAGALVFGTLAGIQVMVFSGRFHQYQCLTAYDVSWPARMAASAGCADLVVTNAAGGVNQSLAPGDIILLSDQMNLTGDSPLIGWSGPEGGTPFVPMRDAFDPTLRGIALRAAEEVGVTVKPEGVYAGLLGPAYETSAEVEMLRRLGADVVGMSTIHEVIAARALGLRVLGFSLVTNVAAGVGLSHGEVLEAGRAAADDLTRLMLAILPRL